MRDIPPLIHARSLKRLVYNGACWGAYGQLAAITGPIFTGYALWMGLKPQDIALVASIVSLAGLIQPFSFVLTRKLQSQKRFVIGFGLIEATLIASILSVPFVSRNPSIRFVLVATLTLGGTLMGHLVSPLFNSWFSTLLPEGSLSRFLGRRMVAVNLSAGVVGFVAGRILDLVGGTYVGFLVPYMLALAAGAGGYWVLRTIPFPKKLKTEKPITFVQAIVGPLKHMQFRRLLAFYLSWAFATLVAEPFYNVLMIQDLGVSYSAIAVYYAVVLGVGVLGYRVWGTVVERFGGKPVLQLLMVPRFLLPLSWIFLTAGNHHYLLPIIMVVNGFVFSGLTVAVNTLLFGTVPQGPERSAFFANWAFSTSVLSFIALGIGSLLASVLATHVVVIAGLQLDSIRIIFAVAGVLLVVPLFLLPGVTDVRATPVANLLGQVRRGNPLAFVYNAFLLSWVKESRQRARAIRRMGKSRSPMAIEQLIQAMEDVSPEVREQAVKGLGDSGTAEAVSPLIDELADEESDVRAVAAEALGKLRHPSGIEPLFSALGSEDIRVVISAVRALGAIGGRVVKNRLYEKLKSSSSTFLFPTLVDALSSLGDVRVVEPAMVGLRLYRSSVIRLQLLNAVCRALGAANRFYELLSEDDLKVVEQLDQTLKQLGRDMGKLPLEFKARAVASLRELQHTLETGAYVSMPQKALDLARSATWKGRTSEAGTRALELFVEEGTSREAERPEIFSVVCIRRIVSGVV